MALPDAPPTAVLADAVVEAMDGLEATALVFCTFVLEPVFFEDHILARLMGLVDRGSERVRRALLQERLRRARSTLVLYDARGRLADGPPVQHVEYVPVSLGSTVGCLHAKHVLGLLGPADEPAGMLLVTTSANLTQAGWWKNVECADVRILRPGETTPLQPDLEELLIDLGQLAGVEDLEAESARAVPRRPGLVELWRFVRHRLDAPSSSLDSGGGAPRFPRLWTGRKPLPDFLNDHLPEGAKVEIVAPYVDEKGEPLRRLVTALKPRAVAAMLPVDRDEKAVAGAPWVATCMALGIRLSALDVDRSMGARSDETRFVHAKVVRAQQGERAWCLVGSPNLSNRGHAGWRADDGPRNLETAILVQEDPVAGPWLQDRELPKEIPPRSTTPPEEEDVDKRTLHVRVRVDWRTRAVLVAVTPDEVERVGLGRAGQPVGSFVPAVRVACGEAAGWVSVDEASTATLLGLLEKTRVLAASAEGHPLCELMVEEVGQADGPVRVDARFTPAEILEHWSLLSDVARQHHAADVLGGSHRELDPEAPLGSAVGRRDHRQTMFDAFAGVIHAFLILGERVMRAIAASRLETVADVLLGQQADSLPTLLDHLEEHRQSGTGDPVYRLVTLLCASELWDQVSGAHKEEVQPWRAAHPHGVARLEEALARKEAAWAEVLTDTDGLPAAELRRWVEAWWVRPVVTATEEGS